MNPKTYLLKAKLILASILFISGGWLFGQATTCQESEPFCTGTIYTFPAGTTGSAQPGAYYGCLLTQPAPVWYHMLIEDPGPITIYMYSTPLVDIDFICWGPFNDPYDPCVAGLTQNKVVDCSYSPNPTEYCNIPNGQTGEYYILLITNYSQQVCNITFSQTGGTGSTDCTILPPPVGNNGPLCVGETLELTASFVVNATYLWSGPAGFISTQQNPVIPNVTLSNAGDYSCVITVNGNSSDPAVTNVIINNKPTASLLSEDTTICSGTPAHAIFQLIGAHPFPIRLPLTLCRPHAIQLQQSDGYQLRAHTGLRQHDGRPLSVHFRGDQWGQHPLCRGKRRTGLQPYRHPAMDYRLYRERDQPANHQCQFHPTL